MRDFEGGIDKYHITSGNQGVFEAGDTRPVQLPQWRLEHPIDPDELVSRLGHGRAFSFLIRLEVG